MQHVSQNTALHAVAGASQKTTGIYYDDSWAYDIYSSGAACSVIKPFTLCKESCMWPHKCSNEGLLLLRLGNNMFPLFLEEPSQACVLPFLSRRNSLSKGSGGSP